MMLIHLQNSLCQYNFPKSTSDGILVDMSEQTNQLLDN